MGVSIFPVSGHAVTDKNAYEAMKTLKDGNHELFESLAKELLQSRGIDENTEEEKLTRAESLIRSCYNAKNREERLSYSRLFHMANEYFPHWSGDLKWDGTDNFASQHIVYVNPQGRGKAPNYDRFDVSYSGYNKFRDLLAKALIGVSPEEVWENPEKYADNAVSLLVNGSDAEGVILNPVVEKISAVLNTPESFEKINKGIVALYEDDYYLSSRLPERYEYFAKMFEATAKAGCHIAFG